MIRTLVAGSQTLGPALLQVLDDPEVVVELGVVDGSVAELALVLNSGALFDQELDNQKVVVHGGIVQSCHPQEVPGIKLGSSLHQKLSNQKMAFS